MRRFMFICLALAGIASMPFLVYKGPVCSDVQKELKSRVKAFITMHAMESAPTVAVKQTCGLKAIPDPLWFFGRSVSYQLGWTKSRPLTWQDLRLKSTQLILQHPDLGAPTWDVRLDTRIPQDTVERIEDMLARYLKIQGNVSLIRFKQDQIAEVPASSDGPKGKDLQSSKSSWLESIRKPLRGLIFFMLLLFSYPFLHFVWIMLRKSKLSAPILPVKENSDAAGAAAQRDGLGLLTPLFVADWRMRTSEMLSTWHGFFPDVAGAEIKSMFDRDREASSWALVHAQPEMRQLMLAQLSPEQIMSLETFVQSGESASLQSELSALARYIAFIARELGKLRQWTSAPLFLHCLTGSEWRQLASQLTRSRRRFLSYRLNPMQADVLRLPTELPFEWNQAARSLDSEDLVVQKVRAALESEALGLRDCLSGDQQALASLDAFYAQLSGDAGLNTELALLVLASAGLRRRTFAAHAAAGDPALAAAMQELDPESAALALYDCDAAIQARMLAELGPPRDAVAASLSALLEDRAQMKKWKMRSRSLQRFLERQLLIAQLFV